MCTDSWMSGKRTGSGLPAQLWSYPQPPHQGLWTLRLSDNRTFALRETLFPLYIAKSTSEDADLCEIRCYFSGGTHGAGVVLKGTPCWWGRTTPKQRPTKAGWAGLVNHAHRPYHNRVSELCDGLFFLLVFILQRVLPAHEWSLQVYSQIRMFAQM